MTDDDALELIKASLEEIREGTSKYGVVHIIISAGEVKFVNVERPSCITREKTQ